MAAGGSPNGTTGAPPQAGVLEGDNPIEFNPSNPIMLFIIQASTDIAGLSGPARPAGYRVSGRVR